MIVTPENDHRNHRQSLLTAALLAATGLFVGIWASSFLSAGLGIAAACIVFQLMLASAVADWRQSVERFLRLTKRF